MSSDIEFIEVYSGAIELEEDLMLSVIVGIRGQDTIRYRQFAIDKTNQCSCLFKDFESLHKGSVNFTRNKLENFDDCLSDVKEDLDNFKEIYSKTLQESKQLKDSVNVITNEVLKLDTIVTEEYITDISKFLNKCLSKDKNRNKLSTLRRMFDSLLDRQYAIDEVNIEPF